MTEEEVDGVTESIPRSEDATSPADMPPDFGEPGVADFADPAWDEVPDEEEGETPGEGEPKEEDEDDEEEGGGVGIPLDLEEEEDVDVVPPAGEDELTEPDEPDDYDPEA